MLDKGIFSWRHAAKLTCKSFVILGYTIPAKIITEMRVVQILLFFELIKTVKFVIQCGFNFSN